MPVPSRPGPTHQSSSQEAEGRRSASATSPPAKKEAAAALSAAPAEGSGTQGGGTSGGTGSENTGQGGGSDSGTTGGGSDATGGNEHITFKTRFKEAFENELQRWVNAAKNGTIDGPSAWDGYLAAATCEAGSEAIATGTRVEVEYAPKPAFYN